MERTIKVTGKGKLSVKPDLIRLVMGLEGIFKDYDETLERSLKQIEEIKDIFEGLGFERSDIKTLSFNIDTEYESYQAEDKTWKKRFIGYRFHHSVKVEFDMDNKRLGRILYSLVHADECPEFNIFYTVKDAEKAKDELIQNALKDSIRKAELISIGAGVKLGDIISIDYSFNERDIVSKPIKRMMETETLMLKKSAASDSYDMDIEPEDIDLSDTLTVIWNIK